MRYPLPWFPLSDGPNRCSYQTKPGCRLYRSSLSGCRFGRSGSSGFPVCFRRLRWSSCGTVPGVRSCRDRYRDRYICRPVGFLARGGCVGPVAELCQGFVAVGIGIEIGISAVRLDFLQEVAAVPNESGFLFEAV